MTDLCDLTDLAICRMYSSAGQVWRGFAKNASEGLGSAVGIWFWTLFLIVGQVLPFYILLASIFPESNRYHTLDFWIMPSVTIALLLMMRLHLSWRFRQPVFTAFLHPLAVVVLLSIQWYAWCLRLVGVRTGWKGRTPPA